MTDRTLQQLHQLWRWRGLDRGLELGEEWSATFALRTGITTFNLSRYMGASLTMIERHYGHLVKDSRQHAIDLLDTNADVHAVDVRWTLKKGSRPPATREKRS